VFAIFNEEHGFFGSVFLIILYLVFFMRMIWLATSVQRFFDSVLVVGIMSIFFWHTFINMAMVMGLIPVVGVPLPFLSYGGSFMLATLMACGLLMHVYINREASLPRRRGI
jgi:rod shape determining protein RodA